MCLQSRDMLFWRGIGRRLFPKCSGYIPSTHPQIHTILNLSLVRSRSIKVDSSYSRTLPVRMPRSMPSRGLLLLIDGTGTLHTAPGAGKLPGGYKAPVTFFFPQHSAVQKKLMDPETHNKCRKKCPKSGSTNATSLADTFCPSPRSLLVTRFVPVLTPTQQWTHKRMKLRA